MIDRKYLVSKKWLIPLLLFLGCGTIMHGTTQDIGVSSNPTSASVTVDNQPKGKTPIAVEMKRKDKHVVKVELEGYKPYEIQITKSVTGWVWGNVLFGGLIGLAVDAISGGLYKLKPDQIMAQLSKEDIGKSSFDEILYIFVTLEPDPSWEKIGNLKDDVGLTEGEK